MGGTMAMACLSRRPDLAKSFISIAAPWNFAKMPRLPLQSFFTTQSGPLTQTPSAIQSPMLQAAFAQSDPFAVPLKYYHFGRLLKSYQAQEISPETQAEYRAFIAMEDWVNSDRSFSMQLAWECLHDWFQQNKPHRGCWQIQGYPIKPYHYYNPALILTPIYDTVVPPQSAKDLADILPNATLCQPKYGHVSLLTSAKSQQQIWPQLINWIKKTTQPMQKI